MRKDIGGVLAVLRTVAVARHLSIADDDLRAMAESVWLSMKDTPSTESWIECIAEAMRKYEHG